MRFLPMISFLSSASWARHDDHDGSDAHDDGGGGRWPLEASLAIALYLNHYPGFGVRYDSVCRETCRQYFRVSRDCSPVLERISGRHGSAGPSPLRRLPSERGSRARLYTGLNGVTRRSRWVFTPGFSRHYDWRTTSPRLPSTICLDENCRMPISLRTGERPSALALNPNQCNIPGRFRKNRSNCHDAEASRSCCGPGRPARI